MPFLSKVRINPMRDTGRRILRNPHVTHGMVLMGLPDQPGTERVLWRWEATNPCRPELLILTESKPDWTHVVEQAGWPHADGEHFTIRDYSPLFAQLAIGREFAFRLTASPVQNTKKPVKPTPAQQQRHQAGATRGFRVAHRTATHQLQWLLQRAPSCGFDIPFARTGPAADGNLDVVEPPRDVRITARNTHRFSKNDRAADTRRQVILTTATYEGKLCVTDPDLLREKLLTGIGPGKAYGCGLLTLAPLTGGHHA